MSRRLCGDYCLRLVTADVCGVRSFVPEKIQQQKQQKTFRLESFLAPNVMVANTTNNGMRRWVKM